MHQGALIDVFLEACILSPMRRTIGLEMHMTLISPPPCSSDGLLES